MPTKYIIVTGGVLSGLGKGVAAASIGAILRMIDVKRCTIKKLDPYLNVDPGTMNPIEHGEVFVTRDGAETDLDVGYYERFADIDATSKNSTSSGQILQQLLQRERRGDFLGKTVQMVPHFTDELKAFIRQDEEAYDVVICEIGGSVGDIEAMAFYEALRQLRVDVGEGNFALVHLTYLIHYQASDELKTKPAQNAIRELMQVGLRPDILLCRRENNRRGAAGASEHEDTSGLPPAVISKLAQYCSCIIDAPNVACIYHLPMCYVRQGLPGQIHRLLYRDHPRTAVQLNTTRWTKLGHTIDRQRALAKAPSTRRLRVAIVGKYVGLHDAYCSLVEAVRHACWSLCRADTRTNKGLTGKSGGVVAVEFVWYDARTGKHEHGSTYAPAHADVVPETPTLEAARRAFFQEVDAVVIPGGFGATGLEEIVACAHCARILEKPVLGICLGMQLMVVEYLRHKGGVPSACSAEMVETAKGEGNAFAGADDEPYIAIGRMDHWTREKSHATTHVDVRTQLPTASAHATTKGTLGGTMRLGEYTIMIRHGTRAAALYGPDARHLQERHRHRYEVRSDCVPRLEARGMVVSGLRDGLVEMVEVPNHPFYIGCQFHPEYRSTPFKPHPLFVGLLRAAL